MTSDKSRVTFVLSIRNDVADDLELRKVYQLVPDRPALRDGYVRVIVESGEDYLYPADYFVPVAAPLAVSRMLALQAIEAPVAKGQTQYPA